MATHNSQLFPLFLKGEETNPIDNEFSLYMHGCTAGRSGLFGNCDLYIYGSSVVNASMNLFLQNHGPESLATYFNLYTQGENYYINGNVPLYISNSGSEGQVNLFIQGSGVTAGAMPLSTFMSLFIKRNEPGAITLFLQGPGTEVNNSITLYTHGAYLASSGLDLCIPDIVGVLNNNMQLYTHGF